MSGRGHREFSPPWWLKLSAMLLLLMAALLLVYYGRNGTLPFMHSRFYTAEIRAAAERHGLPPELVRAVVRRESRFDASAVGGAGEIGLMQLLPSGAAAEWARVNKRPAPGDRELFDPEFNLEIGCWYLARAMKRWRKYRCAAELALAEYNAGAKNAARWAPADPRATDVTGRIDYPGTRDYVREIMEDYRRHRNEK